MNLKTILILTMILLSVSLCGCIETNKTEETLKVVSYYPTNHMLLCVDTDGAYITLYMNNLMTQKEIDEIGRDNLLHRPDMLYESDENMAYVIFYESDGGIFGVNRYEEITAYINSSVIDSKQV